MRPEELDDYFHSLTSLKREYADDITIYIGLESEYVPEMMPAQKQLLKDYPVDYMILGEHFLYPEQKGIYTSKPTKEETELEYYVNLVIEAMETSQYLYVAHPDLFHFIGDHAIYEKHFRRLCAYLKEKEIPIEINMLGWKDRRHYPNAKFLQIAQAVGNTAIIGCDAHAPEALNEYHLTGRMQKISREIPASSGRSLAGAGGSEIIRHSKQRTKRCGEYHTALFFSEDAINPFNFFHQTESKTTFFQK